MPQVQASNPLFSFHAIKIIIGRLDDDPATQRIILKIAGFQEKEGIH